MRQDQHNVTVSINGTNLGTFDKQTGGELDSEETKYKPGNMAPQLTLGGSTTVSNVVVQRLYELTRDHTLVPFLKSMVGRGSVTVVKQPLDVNGAPFGSPLVYQGVLKKLTFPEADSEATTAPGLLVLEVSTAGIIS